VENFLHRRRNVADIGDLGPRAGFTHQERRFLDRVVTDGDDEIGTLDCIVDVVAFGQRRSAKI